MPPQASNSPGTTVLVGPFYTRREAARQAHLPARELVAAPGLIRLDADLAVEEAYLAFQFDRAGIRPDIAEAVIHLLGRRLHPCTAADWLARSHPGLGNKSPLDWLGSGARLDTVLKLADTAGQD